MDSQRIERFLMQWFDLDQGKIPLTPTESGLLF